MRARGSWGLLARVLWTALLLAGFALSVPAAPVGAQDPGESVIVVQPGDALPALAERFGLSVRALMHLNGIRHPRDLYPGQRLLLGEGRTAEAGRLYALRAGESLPGLSRATGWPLHELAVRSGLLLPTGLRAGQQVWLPGARPAMSVLVVSYPAAAAPRVAAAVAGGSSWWAVMRLNPAPVARGAPVMVPAGGGALPQAGSGEAPLVTALALSSQPVARGETVAFRVETRVPVTCSVAAFGVVESCMPGPGGIRAAEPGTRWEGVVALSPMLAPGAYTVTLTLTPDPAEPGAATEVPLGLWVSAGRYDFERLDLPSDRQVLLDPQLSQVERETVAALRQVRTPERLWAYPFVRPIETQVSSYFGSRRSYGYGFGSFHAGTDFDGQVGMAVVAPADGMVLLAEPWVVRGNALLIDHGQGVVTGFWHLSAFEVVAGERVTAGQVVAAVGNTGLSTGPHLHWELWLNGVPVNPLSWLDPAGAPALLGEADFP